MANDYELSDMIRDARAPGRKRDFPPPPRRVVFFVWLREELKSRGVTIEDKRKASASARKNGPQGVRPRKKIQETQVALFFGRKAHLRRRTRESGKRKQGPYERCGKSQVSMLLQPFNAFS